MSPVILNLYGFLQWNIKEILRNVSLILFYLIVYIRIYIGGANAMEFKGYQTFLMTRILKNVFFYVLLKKEC